MLMKYEQVDVKDIKNYLDDGSWDLQQKLDGVRARLAENTVISGNGVPLKSSAAAPVTAKIIEFAKTLPGDIELDGEIVAGKHWWIFDVPKFGSFGHHTPWRSRRAILLGRIRKIVEREPWIDVVPTYVTREAKHRAWADIVAAGVEGAILKHTDGPVTDGRRVGHVLKAKITHTVDCFVLERGPGNAKGNWMSLGIFRKDGTAYEVGRCSIIGKPYAAPGEVVEIRYLYAGAGGRLVQPTHLRNRPDKRAEDCRTDQLHFVCKRVLTKSQTVAIMG